MTDFSTTLDNSPDGTAPTTANGLRHRLVQPVWLVGVIIACLVFFAFSSPKSVPSVLLIAGFIALGIMLFASLQLVLRLSGLYGRLGTGFRRGIFLLGSVLPVLLLMMQSVGQLTIRDVLTLGGLFLIGIFYAARIGHSRQP